MTDLNDKLKALIAEEEAILMRVKEAVRVEALRQDPDMRVVTERLLELRDQAASAPEKDLPTIFDQLNIQQAMARRSFAKDLPDMRAPYFAHLVLEENQQQRHILIGQKTFLDSKHDVTIIDWRNAPLAKIFFNFKEGDDFESQLPGRLARGRVIARRVLNFEMGKLVGIVSPEVNLIFAGANGWQSRTGAELHFVGGQGSATGKVTLGSGLSGHVGPEVSALLDKHQYQILQTDPDQTLLILGGAGSGKTTVAIHRLASLQVNYPKRFPQNRLLVIVPEEGLVRLSRKLLASLQLEKVRLATFDDWIVARGQYLFRDLPKTIYRQTPSRVSRLKRSAYVKAAFPYLAQRRIEFFGKILSHEVTFIDDIADIFADLKAANLGERIDKLEKLLTEKFAELKGTRRKITSNFPTTIRKLRKSLSDMNFDRLELFSNRDLLEKIVASSEGALELPIVNEVLAHSRLQFAESMEEKYAAFSPEALLTLDEKAIDEDTPDEIANTVDVEDFAVLQALLFYYTGKYQTDRDELYTYNHMVIDEAQDFSPLELSVLAGAVATDGSLTVAGDAMQQTDISILFLGWSEHLQHLGIDQVEAAHLTTSYRCPKPVMNFAYDVLGPLAKGPRPKAFRDGLPVRIDQVSSEGFGTTMVIDELEELLRKEPKASLAIICASEQSAVAHYKALQHMPNIRFVENGNFEFTPGIDVVDVTQVKGLEFDYVIIPDADNQSYPETDSARRLLHVAATRAIHQLWVLAVGTKSQLLNPPGYGE